MREENAKGSNAIYPGNVRIPSNVVPTACAVEAGEQVRKNLKSGTRRTSMVYHISFTQIRALRCLGKFQIDTPSAHSPLRFPSLQPELSLTSAELMT